MAQHTDSKDPIANVEDALTKTELYIERNRNILLGVLGGIVVLVGGYFAWRTYVAKPLAEEARAAMFRAELLFAKDSFNLALNGDSSTVGFLQIIDEFGSTPSGNLAHFYAGICYLHLEKFEEAIEHLDEYSGKDILSTSMALGAKGDALMELGKTQEAIDQYAKAAGKNENQLSSPYYLKKAAIAYEELGNYEKSLEIYKKIRKDFFQSTEGREAEKDIARTELLVQQQSGK